jgi:hypothetical protein
MSRKTKVKAGESLRSRNFERLSHAIPEAQLPIRHFSCMPQVDSSSSTFPCRGRLAPSGRNVLCVNAGSNWPFSYQLKRIRTRIVRQTPAGESQRRLPSYGLLHGNSYAVSVGDSIIKSSTLATRMMALLSSTRQVTRLNTLKRNDSLKPTTGSADQRIYL